MSKIPKGLSFPITPSGVYDRGVPEIPDGWEFVRFGLPQKQDHYLVGDPGISALILQTLSDHVGACPFIIVRRIQSCELCGNPVHQCICPIFRSTDKRIPAKPPTCARSIVHGHCCCKNRCCYCHYEVGKPGKNLQWVVEFPYDEPAGPTPEGLLQQATFRVIRQVKPITREDLEKARSETMAFLYTGAASHYAGGPFNMVWIKMMLRELGIAVED